MKWPLLTDRRILPDDPGKFGAERRLDKHTGVDLYCDLGTAVVAMEDGEVAVIEAFTGPNALDPSPWWNDTQIVLVKGAETGLYIGYGEISEVVVSVGMQVKAGDILGYLNVPVLKKFKGRPMVMLHLEAYREIPQKGSATVWWHLQEPQPASLVDPTFLLQDFDAETFDLGTYDGVFSRAP